ncbi:hypothetical protein [Actinomadura darangshiensis]|uniref:hypothetical protein n=1 Tax=Actinomadura darangshiensis TaxID=705336 RepID=UPI001FB6F1D5|nr:hypothetical protein [Actinomadura darangshiensis]
MIAAIQDRSILGSDPRAAIQRAYTGLGWVTPRVLQQCPPPEDIYYDPHAAVWPNSAARRPPRGCRAAAHAPRNEHDLPRNRPGLAEGQRRGGAGPPRSCRSNCHDLSRPLPPMWSSAASTPSGTSSAIRSYMSGSR